MEPPDLETLDEYLQILVELGLVVIVDGPNGPEYMLAPDVEVRGIL